MSDPRIQRISDAIRVIPDFPKPGILFQDVTTILLDPQAFKDSIDIMAEKYASEGVDVIAGAKGMTMMVERCCMEFFHSSEERSGEEFHRWILFSYTVNDMIMMMQDLKLED